TIPDDLVFEILLRLPCKSIARCRCLSKLWASIFDSQDFTDRYLTISSARPQLLFAFQEYGKVFFFSTPQNHEHDNSSPITASYHMSFPVSQAFFGYDPVEKQFKVLSMTFATGVINGVIDYTISTDHQVLTLQAGKLSWRMIECSIPHYPRCNSVCINGVLYYIAENVASSPTYRDMIIVSFDFRSEKFSFIEVAKPFFHSLINFNGKLASVTSDSNYFDRASTCLNLRVLDDIEKNEWSKHVYKLP
ncbi:unnamed protein product, partial [Brassica rapa subsp. narinosa]